MSHHSHLIIYYMKVKLEAIKPGIDSSFAILLTPKLNEIFYWHFHPEYEIVYVEAESGVRHVGDHISKYEGSDLVFIGPNIPHLNFDYGVKTIAETVVIQMKEHFLGQPFFALPEMTAIKALFDKAKEWLMAQGMEAMDGPINFGERDRWCNCYRTRDR